MHGSDFDEGFYSYLPDIFAAGHTRQPATLSRRGCGQAVLKLQAGNLK